VKVGALVIFGGDITGFFDSSHTSFPFPKVEIAYSPETVNFLQLQQP
jgi:hypothetical protein